MIIILVFDHLVLTIIMHEILRQLLNILNNDFVYLQAKLRIPLEILQEFNNKLSATVII